MTPSCPLGPSVKESPRLKPLFVSPDQTPGGGLCYRHCDKALSPAQWIMANPRCPVYSRPHLAGHNMLITRTSKASNTQFHHPLVIWSQVSDVVEVCPSFYSSKVLHFSTPRSCFTLPTAPSPSVGPPAAATAAAVPHNAQC